MPIQTMRKPFPQLGSISCGYQDAKEKTRGRGEELVTFPRRSRTLVFHSNDLQRLEVIQSLEVDGKPIGGEIRQSPTSTPEFGKWDLVSGTTSIVVHVPPVEDLERIAPQYMQAWASSGLVRECDGITTLRHRLDPVRCADCKAGRSCKQKPACPVVGELSDKPCPCICQAQGLEGEARCKPSIRLFVILADLWMDMRGLGVWQVRSTGWKSNQALAGELDLYRSMLPALGGAGRFRLCVRMASSRHGEVPELHLELDQTPREVAALSGASIVDAKALPEPDLDEPIGTFIDQPGPHDSGAAAEAQSATPAAEPTPVAAPDVVEVAGVAVPRVEGCTKLSTSEPGMTPTQLNIIKRNAGEIGWAEEDLLEGALHFSTWELSKFSRSTAERFSKFLQEVVADRRGALL